MSARSRLLAAAILAPFVGSLVGYGLARWCAWLCDANPEGVRGALGFGTTTGTVLGVFVAFLAALGALEDM